MAFKRSKPSQNVTGKNKKKSVSTLSESENCIAGDTSVIKNTEARTEGMKKSMSTTILRRMISKNGAKGIGEKLVGAHVSTAKGGLYTAVNRSVDIGGESFALFLKCQRRWDSKPITQTAIDEFRQTCDSHSFLPSFHVLPHGSYLINLGNPDSEKRKRSFDAFLDDLLRCEALSIGLYNFHPGSTVGECTMDESIQFIATSINEAHRLTSKVIIVLENMAGQGHVVGSTFEQLSDIIDAVHDKSRIGVCLDTCHLFSAGYDIRTKESFNKVLNDFDAIIGLSYLKGCHLNDSKGPLGCNKDRHENIGKGFIGLECFRFIMNDDRFNGIPLVLETPADAGTEEQVYQKEIELLYSLIDRAQK